MSPGIRTDQLNIAELLELTLRLHIHRGSDDTERQEALAFRRLGYSMGHRQHEDWVFVTKDRCQGRNSFYTPPNGS